MSTLAEPAAKEAYDALAGAYDVLTADYCHARWLEEIERRAGAWGLTGRRLLDLGCGTGKSFMPLRERGYDVTACDISPRMAAIAAAKAPDAQVLVADVRDLPDLGRFDLVTCLDDTLNYVLERDDLGAVFEGVRRSLDATGIAVWDVNTLATYRSSFASDFVTGSDEVFVAWHGSCSADFAVGDLAEARIDVFAGDDANGWTRETGVHRQRHWPLEDMRRCAGEAGLRVLAVHGQHRGARLDARADELVHIKALFFACRDDAQDRR